MVVAHQAPLSMEFTRQEYWSGLPFPSPGNLLNPGIEPMSPALQAVSLLSEAPGKTVADQAPLSMELFSSKNLLQSDTFLFTSFSPIIQILIKQRQFLISSLYNHA